MNARVPAHPDAARSRLRAVVAIIDREICQLPKKSVIAGEPDPTRTLTAAWAELVGQLALGPEQEVRACPECGQIGMRAATRCGFCWAKLTPPGDTPDTA